MLLSQGSPLETVNNLSHAELKSLYYALKLGMWGYSKDYVLGYHSYLMNHNISQTILASVAGKKFKPTPAKQFHDVFNYIEDVFTLGRGKENRTRMNNPAMKTLVSLKPPQWVIDQMNKG